MLLKIIITRKLILINLYGKYLVKFSYPRNPSSKVQVAFSIEASENIAEANITKSFEESGIDYFKNECEPTSPCKNSGVCKLKIVSGYKCECSKYWEGDNCENDVDECQSPDACLGKNSFCNNTKEGYNCECESTRTGDKCQLGKNYIYIYFNSVVILSKNIS